MNWANAIPLGSVLFAAFGAGGLVVMLKILWVGHASQGKRIGDLESWRLACETVEKERVRVRADTRGVPEQHA